MTIRTLADTLDQTARRYPGRTAVMCDEGRFTFDDLRRRMDAVARAFSDMGIVRGDRVALLAHNCHWYVDLFYVAARLGFTLVPINYRLSPHEVLFVLEDSKPTAFVVEDELYPILDELRSEVPFVTHFFGLGRKRDDLLDFEEIASGPSAPLSTLAQPDDVLCIFYTSGTTGFPKGAMLTNKNVVSNMVNVQHNLPFASSDINLVLTPLFHCAASWTVFCSITAGACSILHRRFDVRETFREIEKHRVTFIHPVQTQVIMMMEDPDVHAYDLSSLRVMQVTVNLHLEGYRNAIRIFGNIIHPGYGLTEAGPTVTMASEDDVRRWGQIMEKPANEVPGFGSSGRVAPGVEMRVVDENDVDVSPGEVGEVLARGDAVMKGYWNRPEVNAEVLRGGWLHTGDLVRLDAQGYLYFVDRKSGMIKSGGENVYPREVENAILSHPDVKECAVIGTPDERWGETVKAVVVCRPGARLVEHDVIEHCKQHLASYKKPTSVLFIDELPRTPTGKVAIGALKQKYGGHIPVK